MIWHKLRSFWINQPVNGALLEYQQHPLANIHQDYQDASYCVLDLETTGLNTDRDEIVSVGIINIDNWRICASSAQHMLVKATQSVGQSAIYHGIRDNELQASDTIRVVMPQILEAMRGRILVVYSADVDVALLNRFCLELYGGKFTGPYVDTMQLGMRRYRMENKAIPEDGLRLHRLRDWYHLPSYKGHHALSDALATAELFLAMASSIAGNKPMPVKRLLW